MFVVAGVKEYDLLDPACGPEVARNDGMEMVVVFGDVWIADLIKSRCNGLLVSGGEFTLIMADSPGPGLTGNRARSASPRARKDR